jgi:hypothetical protein
MCEAKRIFDIPDIRYYALADGIKAIFKRIGKGPLKPKKDKSPLHPILLLEPLKNGGTPK